MKTYLLHIALILAALVLPASAQNGNIVVPPAQRYSHGSWSTNFNAETGTVSLGLSKLTYNHSGYTGTIKLVLWASTRPYEPGVRGWAIGEATLKSLQQNQYYSDIKKTMKLNRPPVGKYYLTLMIQEYGQNGYTIKRYSAANKTTTFR